VIRYNVQCENCGKGLGKKQYKTKYGDFCSKECRVSSKKKQCEVCGEWFIFRDRNTRSCEKKECRHVMRSRPTVLKKECNWCGKLFRPKNEKALHCSNHCRYSRIRLRNYVKERLRKARAAISLQQQKQKQGPWQKRPWRHIDQDWVACRISRLETAAIGKTDEQLWEEKIKSLCEANRYRETMAVLQSKADWGTHNRNQNNDWKYGGAWDRIVFFELKRLRKRASNCQDYLWSKWLEGMCSNHRQRMKRKQAAGFRHGE